MITGMTSPLAFMMNNCNSVSVEYPVYPSTKKQDTRSRPTLATISGTEYPVYPEYPMFFL